MRRLLASMLTKAPALATARLSLRPHAPGDLEDCAALWSDPAVVRHIGGRPFSREEVWSKMLRYAGHWALLGFGYWVVCESASGRFLGEVGLADFHREIEPPFGDAPEAGWVLAPWAHGRGFATEAVRALLAWSDASLGSPRTVCMINPGNATSIRVAQKCGYSEWTRASYKGEDVVLFER
jgi:RimJ/RimL family protein N-acetyltransferase